MPRHRLRLSQRLLNRWFPTVVQYAGIVLILYAAVTRQVALITAATGMILFRPVVSDGRKD